ncbi:GntR family transcriptional regulator [Curtobacterium sp. VKM Ac-1395]|uniref:GntR family transcriptional regulator n=1 Tax=Curtobacterium sp. VKM Ac-1395 TaxID=2783815 RepID=UPI00188D4EB8|nr:GntR family transcriptional regulator [Curtobacterium sp. VKM Ac-1395]MBF4589411.1 GntR family transcriptional regulator [Curtobacterium sp. VKM Ac-1395]
MLYQTTFEDLRSRISAGEFPVGQRLPSEAELLAHYDVSAITLRRALDMLREAGYVARRPRVGTTVVSAEPTARQQPTAHTEIGVVLTNFDDTFGTRVLEGMLDEAGAETDVIVKRTHGDHDTEDAAIRALARRVHGLVVLPSSSEFIPPAVLELLPTGFPVVILDRRYEGIPVTDISTDNIAAGAAATEYLFDLGHRTVALVTSDSRVTSNDDRRRGWVGAHARKDKALDDRLAFHDVESTLPGATDRPEDDVARLAAFVEAHPEATAFVAGEYNIALLLRDALERVGKRVPDDVSIVCFDHPDATFDRRLFRFTHIAQDQPGVGRQAVAQVLRQARGESGSRKILVPAQLVDGLSTAPPPTGRAARAARSPSRR